MPSPIGAGLWRHCVNSSEFKYARADGDYERRDGRMAELKRLARLMDEARRAGGTPLLHVKLLERTDARSDRGVGGEKRGRPATNAEGLK